MHGSRQDERRLGDEARSPGRDKLSDDPRVARLLRDIVEEFRTLSAQQAAHITALARIGQSIAEEVDTGRVLDTILAEARRFNHADAGTVYLVNREAQTLEFLVMQNDSAGALAEQHGGGAPQGRGGGERRTLPDVPLQDEGGQPNTAHVSAYVANTGAVLDIPDVYAAQDFAFTGTKEYDRRTGYRSVSMRVVPMRDHEDRVIGVLQLINAQDLATGKVVPFAPALLSITLALAGQAAVVLAQRHLRGRVTELEEFTDEQARRIRELAEIGKALSAEKDVPVLLERILTQARRVTNADGGTLYLVSDDGSRLDFHVLHNETLQSHMGGTSGNPITLPPVPLFDEEGRPNDANVSAYVAHAGRVVNIEDVYRAPGFNFAGTKTFDRRTGYRSRSMLVVPMRDHEERVIGVLQLLNARDPATGGTASFGAEQSEVAAALASQAAVVLTQQRLIRELKNLFDSFIRAIATAIDEKSRYTGGHIARVSELTIEIARRIHEAEEGPFAATRFGDDEMEAIRIAAWMHDTGKITTPENIVDKARKLEAQADRIETVRARWQAIRLSRRVASLEEKLALCREGPDPDRAAAIDAREAEEAAALEEDLAFLEKVNEGGEFLSDEARERLRGIAARTYEPNDGSPHPYLTPDELENLSIGKGTLTARERRIIENHAAMSIRILEELAWPRKLRGVPAIAGAHHEKLDGTGYPRGLRGDQIGLPARIMAVADIFEALSARDRPYKKAMALRQAVSILRAMARDGHIDADIVELFVRSGLVLDYARKHLDPAQWEGFEGGDGESGRATS